MAPIDWAGIKERSWPHYDKYFGRCLHCKKDFGGPKRELCCYPCHMTRAAETLRAQQERDRSWAEAKAMFENEDAGA